MNGQDEMTLIRQADAVRRDRYGDGVWIRGLLEFTNRCRQNCLYCGLRRDNRKVRRYSLDEEEIFASVDLGYEAGIRTFVLQGGEDPKWSTSRLCRTVDGIKRRAPGSAVTLSCGIMERKAYRSLASAGADRYLLRFETCDGELHGRLRDGVSLSDRLKALIDLRDAGMELGSGFMVGLPGETEEMRMGNLTLCRDLELDMVGIGPFIANPETPLADFPSGSMEETVRLTARLRLMLPDANIPATTAAGSLSPGGREAMLAAGANVLMPNITPPRYRDHYRLYPGKTALSLDHLPELNSISEALQAIGRRMDMGRGNSLSSGRRKSETI